MSSLIWRLLREVVAVPAAAAVVTAVGCSWAPCPVHFMSSARSDRANMWTPAWSREDDDDDDDEGLTPSLLIWNGRIMDRMWICCRILLFLGVCVSSSLHEGDDASCDGAFDVYFVLDRWGNVCMSVCVWGSEAASRGRVYSFNIFIVSAGTVLTLSSPCKAVFSSPRPSAASLQSLCESFLSDHQC